MAKSTIQKRVFISSVVKGFQVWRDAATSGTQRANEIPIRVNEDAPASCESSRNLCLSLIDSCDALISIIGDRAGYKSVTGRYVIEEELEQARLRRIPILMFIIDGNRELEAQNLIDKFSSYVGGLFFKSVRTPDELNVEVEKALRFLPGKSEAKLMHDLTSLTTKHFGIQSSPTLRVIVYPDHEEVIFEDARCSTDSFVRKIADIARSDSVLLFDAFAGITPSISGEFDTLSQTIDRRKTELRLNDEGFAIIDLDVSPKAGSMHGSMMEVFLGDIHSGLTKAQKFIGTLLDHFDPHERYGRWNIIAAMSQMEYRNIVGSLSNSSSGSVNMTMPKTFCINETPIKVDRNDLRNSGYAAEKITSRLKRAHVKQDARAHYTF
ncbi:MAG: DUF4062 domain-containing protein [Proteobacteria bacterium]|nr:MAG: DUF4062 domain-containing protein [Pseudomonadota bacterium]